MRQLLGLMVGLALVACSSDDESPPAGSGGSGGSAGTAGMAGTGGSAGSDAGSDASAGAAGAAGSPDAGDAGFVPPTMLSQTGLYSNIVDGTLAAGVEFYEPEFLLWSDGATKRRWVQLPPGSKIDTSEMDFWKYPVGTKLWKEFTRDSTLGMPVRVETRLLQKISASEWFMMAFEWNTQQTDAEARPDGVMNAAGTDHDIPSQADCTQCHGNMVDKVLSFSAVQLSHPMNSGVSKGVDLKKLIQDGKLTAPPAGALAEFVVPGNPTERAALGYMHANCGLCHNERSFVSSTVDMQLWLTTAKLGSVQETPSYTTTVNVATQSFTSANFRIKPKNLTDSAVHVRMGERGSAVQMPPVGTELVDTAGAAAVAAWIQSLQP